MSKVKILYIEDDAQQRQELLGRLSKKGFDAIAAESGPRGLALFREHGADAIVCDLHMSKMSGIDVLKNTFEITPKVPFILLTANGSISEAVQALKLGAYDFLLKPVDIDLLDNTIHHAIEHKKMEKALEKANYSLGNANVELLAMQEELVKKNKELRETQSQLVQSEKMAALGNLVAGIAHEINTPVGAINSMHNTAVRAVEKLKEFMQQALSLEQAKDRKLLSALKIIEKSNDVIKSGTERVTNLVRRLRSFARLDEAEVKEADIHEGLEDTLTLTHHALKHRVTVHKNFGDLLPIACFPGRLNQVFLNMIINASQAIKDKGEITITTYRKGEKVYIEIKDTGAGIPKENLDKIFDPGFTTKGVGVGTGLGLSICYQIIKDHQGEIKVDSEVGKGTAFTIILPMDLDKRLGVS